MSLVNQCQNSCIGLRALRISGNVHFFSNDLQFLKCLNVTPNSVHLNLNTLYKQALFYQSHAQGNWDQATNLHPILGQYQRTLEELVDF